MGPVPVNKRMACLVLDPRYLKATLLPSRAYRSSIGRQRNTADYTQLYMTIHPVDSIARTYTGYPYVSAVINILADIQSTKPLLNIHPIDSTVTSRLIYLAG